MEHRYSRPRRFDRNLVVIGAGAAGLVSAYIAATARASVTLVEANDMGGDCLNTGCVPSKALIHAARQAAHARRAGEAGISTGPVTADFGAVMESVRRAIDRVAPHDSAERYRALGVDVRRGRARIVSPWHVDIEGDTLSTRAIVIATGAEPFVPPVPGLEEAGYLTSHTVWRLREMPRRLLVLGGGPAGCELAQAFARLGCDVIQVERAGHLLPREDAEVGEFVAERLCEDGVDVRPGHRAVSVEHSGDRGKALICEHAGERVRIDFDTILVAVGRKPRIAGYGLEELGIPASQSIATNAFLQTLYPNIYACGDVAGPYQFTHAAGHQAWYATVNALFGQFHRFRVNQSAIPAVTFVDPEVARVGLNEREARDHGVAYEVTRYDLEELDRAITEDRAQGFVKVLTAPGRDRILGVTIVSPRGGELLAEFTLAMRHGLGLNKVLATVHAYPTWAEANRHVAGAWKRAHVPGRLLRWAERYHRWRRGGDPPAGDGNRREEPRR